MMKLTKSSRVFRRAMAFVLAAAMTLSAPVATQASAASKKKVPTLSVKKKTLYYNKSGKKSFTLKVKKNKVKKIVKTKWTTSKKSIVKISAKKKTSVKVTAKKKGTAKIKATVTYKVGAKTKTKKLTCKVTSKKAKKPVVTPAPTSNTDVTNNPDVTPAPTDGTTETAAPTQKPDESATPVVTDTPAPEELKVTAVNVVTSTKVNVTFSKAIDKTTDASKFTVSDGASVTGVELNADNTVATLVINGLVADKEYTLTVAGVISGETKLDSFETKFTAKKDEYALELSHNIKDGNVLKADGKANTTITVNLVNSDGVIQKEADQVELKFDTTAGTFSNQRVTVQNGTATNTFTSESLVAPKTALITVTIINAKDSNLLNTVNTMNILLDPNPDEKEVDETAGATLTDIKVQTADKVALFFNKKVNVTDYTKNDAAHNNVYGYDATKMAITVHDGAANLDIPVCGLSAIAGNDKALYAHLGNGTGELADLRQLTDNADVTVTVTDKTKALPVTGNATALLQDITAPSVLKVTNNGLTKLVLEFSEAVNPGVSATGARNKNNYIIDGVPLSDEDTYGVASATPSIFFIKDGVDNKNIVTIQLGKKNGVQQYFKPGAHSILIANVGDAANVTDTNQNKIVTQTLNFYIDEDNSLVTAEVTVQSPEQYLVKLNKEVDGALAILQAEMKLQQWNSTTSQYVNVPTVNQDISIRQHSQDATKFIVEVTKDWTKVYDTANSKKNYFNDKYRLFIPKTKLQNAANGKWNEDIDMPLGGVMESPDLTSPVINKVEESTTKAHYIIHLSEPVQVPGAYGRFVTPDQKQNNNDGVPKPNVVFIKSDNSETVPAVINWTWDEDNAIDVSPSKDLSAGMWNVVVYSISDDVGNTAATLVQPDFEIKSDVVVADDAFRILWIVAVAAGTNDPILADKATNPDTAYNNPNEDVVYVKFNQDVDVVSEDGNVIDTRNYNLNGYDIKPGTSIDVRIPRYNDEVNTVYGMDALKDTIAIHLPKDTLASNSNSMHLKDTMKSKSGKLISNAGQKTLNRKSAGIFTWNYNEIITASSLDTVKKVKDALADEKNFTLKTDQLSAATETFEITKEMSVDFSDSTIKELNINTRSTGTIVVKNLNAATINITAPYANVVFEKVVTTGKVEIKDLLSKLTLENTTVLDQLDIPASVKHHILIKGLAGNSCSIDTVNNNAGATVELDPLTIGTLNQNSAQKLILDAITLTTLNIKAAASLSFENNQSTITTMNIQKDVKLASYSVDVAHSVTDPAPTVNKNVIFNAETGAITDVGAATSDTADYITGGVITKNVAEKEIELTAANFTSLNACTISVSKIGTGASAVTGAAVTVSNWNQNAQLAIQLDAGISIKDYKGISFELEGDAATTLADGGKGLWIQMPKTGGSLAAAFYPGSYPGTPYSNVVIAKEANVKVAVGATKQCELRFDWTDEATIDSVQLADGALVNLGLQLQNVSAGNFTIKNVKLFV